MTTQTPRTLPDKSYTISKRAGHNEWHLCSVPSGFVATVYYQNRAEEIRDALNGYPALKRESAAKDATIARLREALAEIALYDPTLIDAATLGNIARAALQEVQS